MKEIQLTQRQVALVDDQDFEWLNSWKWYAKKDNCTYYACGWIRGERTLMHHLILGKPSKGFETDHHDRSGLNNQRENLRFVTCRQNQQNRRKSKKTSQFPGVHWDKNRQKWTASIRIKKKKKWLGYFKFEFQAFEVYQQAVESLGETVIDISHGTSHNTAIQQRSIS